MIKNLKYIDIDYTENDLEYIDKICNEIENKSEEIVKFFEVKEFKEKITAKLYDNLDDFRNFYKETYHREPKDWVCGFSKENKVYTLLLSEYRKCLSHENSIIEDLERLILHEFIHSVHLKRHNNITVKWISEGAATYLSGQHKDKKEITCTYEELINNAPYHNYKVMFEYVLNTYGKDFILKLIDDEELLQKETKRLFEEAKLFSNLKTPKELNEYMNNNISYGYLGRNGHVYNNDDSNFDSDWLDNYILENSYDIINTKVGNCWDQVEFERNWFKYNNYEFMTIYHQVVLNYNNPYPTHTFLVYKDNDKWHWFENAWGTMKGIHEFNTIEELLNFEYNENMKLLKEFNIKDNEINNIKYFEFNKPKEHITAKEYVEYMLNQKEIYLLNGNKVFDSEHINYIKMNEKYLNDYLNMYNNKEMQIVLFGKEKEFTKEQIINWINKVKENNLYTFTMIEKENNDFIGTIEIMNINDDKGELAITITPNKQGKHYGKEAINAIVEYAYKNVGLRSIDVNVHKSNHRAIHLYENTGFIKDIDNEDSIHMKHIK